MGRRIETREKLVEKERTETITETDVEEEEVEISVCDFCGQDFEDIDPDDLNTVHINPSIPQREFEETVTVPMQSDRGAYMDVREIQQVFNESELLNVDRKPVYKPEPLFSEEHELITTEKERMSDELSEDVIAYDLKIRVPQEQKADLVMEICDHCKQSFANEKKS